MRRLLPGILGAWSAFFFAIAASYYLRIAELPNYFYWVTHQASAYPISAPSGGIAEMISYHGSALYFAWSEYMQLSASGGTYLSIGLVGLIGLAMLVLPSTKAFSALCSALSRIPRMPVFVVLGACAVVLNLIFLWTSDGVLAQPVQYVVTYYYHNMLVNVDYTSLLLFAAASFCILVLVSRGNEPGTVVLKAVRYISLMILPWGLDILAFDRSELFLYTTEFQHMTSIFGWFDNLDLIIASSLFVAFTTLLLRKRSLP